MSLPALAFVLPALLTLPVIEDDFVMCGRYGHIGILKATNGAWSTHEGGRVVACGPQCIRFPFDAALPPSGNLAVSETWRVDDVEFSTRPVAGQDGRVEILSTRSPWKAEGGAEGVGWKTRVLYDRTQGILEVSGGFEERPFRRCKGKYLLDHVKAGAELPKDMTLKQRFAASSAFWDAAERARAGTRLDKDIEPESVD